jgi:SAM-dependent methyltransferase
MPGYWAGEKYTVYYCPGCQTRFADPMRVEPGIYEAIYKNATNIAGYDRYCKYAQLVKIVRRPIEYLASLEEPYSFLKQQIERIDPLKNKEILEVGCGLGYTTFAFRKAGYNVVGMDISEEAVSNARMAYGDYYVAGDVTNPGKGWLEKFDVIFLSEVIEHIPDPVEFFRSCLTLLRPGGVILSTTPDASQSPAGVCWGTDLPPVHLWWFSPKSLIEIGAQIGVEAEVFPMSDCQFVDLSGQGSYPQSTFRENWELNLSPRQLRRVKIEHWLPLSSWLFVALNKYRDYKLQKAGRNYTIISTFKKSA